MSNYSVRYPLGIQTFEKIINGEYLYVDKTEYVYNMTHSNNSYIFLSRPRRFGKSLLATTLLSYFEGRRDLFKGLAIDQLEKDWATYPVLHFDMSTAKLGEKSAVEGEINRMLGDYEDIYGNSERETEPGQRLTGLIKRAYQQTGQKVVVIIDEYDAPLLDVVHEDETLPVIRKVMSKFYTPLKACDSMLRFVFITGITKFSQMSIFSTLNNIIDISMDDEYAGICGITEEEMLTYMDSGIAALADKLKLTKVEAIQELKNNYDGYHFAAVSPDIYNPFSLLNAIDKKTLGSYWFASGTPTYLIEMLRKFNVSPSNLGEVATAVREDFDAPTERMTNIKPLLYQSGYTTIKGYEDGVYLLGIPNREIRIGLMRCLLPNYLEDGTISSNATAMMMSNALARDDVNGMFELLQKLLGSIPYVTGVNSGENVEGHWQQMLYLIFTLVGAKCDVEVHTSHGRIDMVAQSARKLYLIELKLNQSAEAAMAQIDLKDYPSRFALSELPVVKVAANFDQQQRNITGWQVQE